MLDERPDWHQRALCNTGDASLLPVFFGHGRQDWDGRRAKAICAHCEVRPECLADALDADETAFINNSASLGVWGGLTHAERSELIRQQKENPNG